MKRSWDEMFRAFRAKGMDPSDAAFRADVLEKKQIQREEKMMFKLLIVVVGRTGFTDTAWGVATSVVEFHTQALANVAFETLTGGGHSPNYSLDVTRLY